MRITSFIPRALAACLVAAAGVALVPSTASANQSPQALEIPSALVIVKSSNKNQVHYAVQVDESCAPTGGQPVSPYWLMLERGPDVTEPLSGSEERVLGVERQEVASDGIHVTLRAFPAKPLTIHTWRTDGGRCTSAVDMTVAGVTARVASVFVKQKLFGVAYVLLTGVSANGAVVQERVVP
jgi:uncharacterized protein DUF4833